MIRSSDIQMRDPFVVARPDEGLYYLFGTTDRNCWEGPGAGFDFYVGRDLATWDGPFAAFRPPPGFWAETNFWAPEVHHYREAWFMFASFRKAGRPRGTQVLAASSLNGPFLAYASEPVTPAAWECLDGSLFVDERAPGAGGESEAGGEQGASGGPGAGSRESADPWLVFSREWTEVGDGEIWAMPLAGDLLHSAGEPVKLFKASEAPWTAPNLKGCYVTDGPFVRRMRNGKLLMLWSSRAPAPDSSAAPRPYRGTSGVPYALGIALSDSGYIRGPWRHVPEPLFKDDGGHGMIFDGLDGKLYLAIHSPDDTPNERPHFFGVQETADGLELSTIPPRSRTRLAKG